MPGVRLAALALVALLIALLPAHAHVHARRHGAARGVASWYGGHFAGRTMADGTTFNARRPMAASPTLPLGTWVLVCNLRNGRAMALQIRDRGPYVPGRILDLSEAAAETLGFVPDGVVLVSVLPLKRRPTRTIC